eukprot:2624106-Ditylum_brightwellii.AAC.1
MLIGEMQLHVSLLPITKQQSRKGECLFDKGLDLRKGLVGGGAGDIKDPNKLIKRKKGEDMRNNKVNPVWSLQTNKSYGNVIHRSITRENIKLPMWDGDRQSCCLFHFKGRCNSNCTQKYAYSNKMSKEKKDHRRFIKECKGFERKAGK